MKEETGSGEIFAWRQCLDCSREMLCAEDIPVRDGKRIFQGFVPCPYCGSQRFSLMKGATIETAEKRIADYLRKNTDVAKNSTYIEDGVVGEDAFTSAKVRYVFIMKEANDLRSSLVKFLKKGAATDGNGNGGHTWNPICRWLEGTPAGVRYTPEDRGKILESKGVAVVNLKKYDEGNPRTDMCRLREVVKRDKRGLLGQLSLYAGFGPVIYVCCGTGMFDLVAEELFAIDVSKIDHSKKPTYCHIVKDAYLMAFSHPNCTKGDLTKKFVEWTSAISSLCS